MHHAIKELAMVPLLVWLYRKMCYILKSDSVDILYSACHAK